ncbi:WGxxGxxG family protein [Actinosynnema sp. CS-041913]|uniref:WGxxGxxG family protein n=1 Tax=Actinosynnema sp. CS-041913 TaxID=3239917 RepID=UPI003D8BCF8C
MDSVKRLLAASALGAALVGVPTMVASADAATPDAVAVAQDDDRDGDGNNYWGLLGLLGLVGLAGLARRKQHVGERHDLGR